MNPLSGSANRLSACGRALRPWLWRTLLPAAVLDPSGQASPAERQPCRTAGARFTAARVRLRCSIQADRQALPSGSHAERPVQGSRRQEYGTTHVRGPRAEQASKLETRLLLPRSEGGTVARAGGNTCGPLSARLDLKTPLGSDQKDWGHEALLLRPRRPSAMGF